MDENPYVAPENTAAQVGPPAKPKPTSPWSWLLLAMVVASAGCLVGGYYLAELGVGYHQEAEHIVEHSSDRSARFELAAALIDGGMMTMVIGFFVGVAGVLCAVVLWGWALASRARRLLRRSRAPSSL